MLTQEDISKKRGLVGRLLIGSATLAVLGATATLVPAGIVVAKEQASALGEPPVPPEAPLPPEAPDAPGVMVFTDHSDATTTEDGKTKREVHRIVIRRDGETASTAPAVMVAPADGKDKMRRIEIRAPGGLSRDDVLATLKEQGITGKRAEQIADKLEAKRKERFRTVMAPMPPMPPIAPMPLRAWTMDGKAMVMSKCGDGKQAAPIVNRDESSGNQHSRVMMFACSDTAEGKAARLSALKKARDAFAEGDRARGLSEDMRAKVAADLERAIAEIEKSGH